MRDERSGVGRDQRRWKRLQVHLRREVGDAEAVHVRADQRERIGERRGATAVVPYSCRARAGAHLVRSGTDCPEGSEDRGRARGADDVLPEGPGIPA